MRYAWIEGHRDALSSSTNVSAAERVAERLSAMAYPSAQRAGARECGARCAGGGDSCRSAAKLWPTAHRFGSCRRRACRSAMSACRSLLRQALRPVYRKPYRVTTDSAHAKPVVANILNRRFDGWGINQAWAADLTYIPTDEGWLYLACVLDLASRRVVGWSLSDRMKAKSVCDALTMAYWRRKPPPGLIMHSDRGVQYASDEHRSLIDRYRMVPSMSRTGNCWDNSPMESFFKTLKVEWVNRVRYATRAQARLDLIDWIEGFYNANRLHSSINYLSPTSFEKELKAA